MSLVQIFQLTDKGEAAEAIEALVPTYERGIHPNIRGDDLSLWDRFLLEASGNGSMPVLEACIENNANVNCRSDGKNQMVFAILDEYTANKS